MEMIIIANITVMCAQNETCANKMHIYHSHSKYSMCIQYTNCHSILVFCIDFVVLHIILAFIFLYLECVCIFAIHKQHHSLARSFHSLSCVRSAHRLELFCERMCLCVFLCLSWAFIESGNSDGKFKSAQLINIDQVWNVFYEANERPTNQPTNMIMNVYAFDARIQPANEMHKHNVYTRTDEKKV